MFDTIYINALVSCIAILLLTACKPNEEEKCSNYFLSEFDMKAYKGEELACKTHIHLYKYETTYFALKDNHCADFAPFIIYDCNGEEFCYSAIGPCHIEESTYLGIIGIEE